MSSKAIGGAGRAGSRAGSGTLGGGGLVGQSPYGRAMGKTAVGVGLLISAFAPVVALVAIVQLRQMGSSTLRWG